MYTQSYEFQAQAQDSGLVVLSSVANDTEPYDSSDDFRTAAFGTQQSDEEEEP